MALSVMCCGCGCFLGPKGERITATGFSKGEYGFLLEGRLIHTPAHERVGDFRDVQEANDAALKAGWRIDRLPVEGRRDYEENHRCSKCATEEKETRKRVGHHPGAYAGARSGALIAWSPFTGRPERAVAGWLALQGIQI